MKDILEYAENNIMTVGGRLFVCSESFLMLLK